MKRLTIVLLILLCAAFPARAVFIPLVVTPPARTLAYVEYCIDGDTFMARVQNELPHLSQPNEGQLLRVSHLGVDAPNLDECYGPEALSIHRTLIEHTWVWLEWDAPQTIGGDFVAHVLTQDDWHVGTALLWYGAAKYIPSGMRYRDEMLEAQANAQRHWYGIWRACQPYPPPTLPPYPYPMP